LAEVIEPWTISHLFLRILPRKTDHKQLCASIILALKVVESCSKVQKTQLVLQFALKKYLDVTTDTPGQFKW